ncbi:MAG: acetyltransferase [Candidatus Sericytochromatia bacterium]
MTQLLIWGTGGVASHLLGILAGGASRAYHKIGFLHDQPTPREVPLPYPVLGSRRLLESCDPENTHVFPAASTPAVRKAMALHLRAGGFYTPSFIDPGAIVRPGAQLGQGCLIEAFAFVDATAVLGEHVLVGLHASVSHDSRIGDYCSLYSGSRVLGFCQLEEGCLLGSNACLHPNTRMHCWSKAGMLTAVYHDVPAYSTVSGIPARVIQQYQGPQPAGLYPLEPDRQPPKES